MRDDLGNSTSTSWQFTIGTIGDNVHGSYTANEDACMACRTTHQAPGQKLVKHALEQTTCYYCHNGIQTRTDLRSEFGEQINGSSSKKSHHPVPEGTIRCSDCHNPHLNNATNKLIDFENPPNFTSLTNTNVTNFINADREVYVLVGAKHDGVTPVTPGGLKTNYAYLWADSFKEARTSTIDPAGADGTNAWNGVAKPLADAQGKPDSSTSGWSEASSAQKTAISVDETESKAYWTTSLATADKEFNYQLYKFKVPNDAAKILSLRMAWLGYGEPTANYNVHYWMWDFTLPGADKWVEIQNKNLPSDGSILAEKTLNYRTYCNKCHDNSPPSGVNLGKTLNIASSFTSDIHGSANGPILNKNGGRSGAGELKAPFYWGMPALSCADCHDQHGSQSIYHLREKVNGKSNPAVPSIPPALYHYKVDPGYNVNPSRPNTEENTKVLEFCLGCHVSSNTGNTILILREFHSKCFDCHNGSIDHDNYIGIHSGTPITPEYIWELYNCLDCHRHGEISYQHKCGEAHCGPGGTYKQF